MKNSKILHLANLALTWWNKMPVQDINNPFNSQFAYFKKYYPNQTSYSGNLNVNEIFHIWRSEFPDTGKISNKHVVTNGKAAFYACILEDLKNAALECGWAIGVHGSLSNDMDLMAMPWTDDALPVEDMILSLSDCFVDNPFKDKHIIPHYSKPNGRVVYTISIWSDYYLDINVIRNGKQVK